MRIYAGQPVVLLLSAWLVVSRITVFSPLRRQRSRTPGFRMLRGCSAGRGSVRASIRRPLPQCPATLLGPPALQHLPQEVAGAAFPVGSGHADDAHCFDGWSNHASENRANILLGVGSDQILHAVGYCAGSEGRRPGGLRARWLGRYSVVRRRMPSKAKNAQRRGRSVSRSEMWTVRNRRSPPRCRGEQPVRGAASREQSSASRSYVHRSKNPATAQSGSYAISSWSIPVGESPDSFTGGSCLRFPASFRRRDPAFPPPCRKMPEWDGGPRPFFAMLNAESTAT